MGSNNATRKQGIRPFSHAQERRQWSHWGNVRDTRPDAPNRPESDPDGIEATIARSAEPFALKHARDARGRWTAGGRGNPDRDVRLYLTRQCYELTNREVGKIFGLKTRKAIMRAVRRGRELIEGNRENPKPPFSPPKNEPKW